jgi:ABC transporter substrate binding protein
LVRIPVNVIVTDTTSATLAAFDATRTIPIVMGTTGADPVALGLAKSISRPGGNVTGAQMLTGLSQKRLQLLKQAFPDAEHIAVLANPKDEISVSEMPKAEMAAAQMGVHLIPFVASAPAELRALEPSALSHSDGLLVMPGGMFWNNRATIIGIAASMARVPAIYPEREYADDGGLIAYGPNPVVHFRLAAGYVDRILRGANPGDLPINVAAETKSGESAIPRAWAVRRLITKSNCDEAFVTGSKADRNCGRLTTVGPTIGKLGNSGRRGPSRFHVTSAAPSARRKERDQAVRRSGERNGAGTEAKKDSLAPRLWTHSSPRSHRSFCCGA